MSLSNLNAVFPDLSVDTTAGPLSLYDYFGSGWGIVFSHPKAFTPVCTTELAQAAKLLPEFTRRGVKIIALSCDSVEDNKGWQGDIDAVAGTPAAYPIICDTTQTIARSLGMLDEDLKDSAGMPLTVRKVFVIGPDRKVKAQIVYPTAVGRNFKEIIRLVDALQVTASNPVATPVNWEKGSEVVVVPSLSAEDAAAKFPGHRTVELPSGKCYLRMTADPSAAAGTSGGSGGCCSGSGCTCGAACKCGPGCSCCAGTA